MKNIIEWLSYSKENEICISLKEERKKVLAAFAFISWLIMLASQFVLLFKFNGPQLSDSIGFVKAAEDCCEAGFLYPSKLNLTDPYISANGLINFLILIFKFTKNLKVFYAANIALVQVLLFSCIYIIKKIFADSNVHYWFTILFCLLPTMSAEIANVRTEIPFTALCFLGIAFLYSENKCKSVLCGIILALANWIRPLGIVTLIVCMFIIIYKKEKFRHALGIISSYVVILLIIGGISYSSCGQFIYQSSTLGCNLIMSANDDADGSFIREVFHEGKSGYIPPEQAEKMTYKDFDKFYKDISFEWIKNNPKKYILQSPKKLFYLYSTETYAVSTLYNNEVNTSGLDYIKDIAAKITGNSAEKLSLADCISCFNQAWYMLNILLCVVGVVISFVIRKWRSMLPFYLLVLGFTAVIVIIVGGARYHFPMLPVIFMTSALALQYFSLKISDKASAKKQK